jgi:hypothetical protein
VILQVRDATGNIITDPDTGALVRRDGLTNAEAIYLAKLWLFALKDGERLELLPDVPIENPA